MFTQVCPSKNIFHDWPLRTQFVYLMAKVDQSRSSFSKSSMVVKLAWLKRLIICQWQKIDSSTQTVLNFNYAVVALGHLKRDAFEKLSPHYWIAQKKMFAKEFDTAQLVGH